MLQSKQLTTSRKAGVWYSFQPHSILGVSVGRCKTGWIRTDEGTVDMFDARSVWHRWWIVCPVLLTVFASAALAQSVREQIEADWHRHDQQRLAQIRGPGLVRFVEKPIQWPGLQGDDRLRVPKGPTPTIDGKLGDPCWQQALRIEPAEADLALLLLCHDDRQLYVGVSLPTKSEPLYRGHHTARDAAGAVDGVKDGRYGFHTWLDANPWWQVDLGTRRAIARIVVYNRLDYAPGLHNADALTILTSDDEKTWTLRHDNKGKHFGGVAQGKPLEVSFDAEEIQARFVRLQVPSKRPLFFHLDEVEIFGPGAPAENIALKRPAKQSSLSRWSRGGQQEKGLFTLGSDRIAFAAADAPAVAFNDRSGTKDQACVIREKDRTFAEVSFPLRGAKQQALDSFCPPGAEPTGLAMVGDWGLVWRAERPLGFGKNRIHLELTAAGPIDPPIDITVESVVFTPARLERQIAYQKKLDGATTTSLDVNIDHEGAAAVIVSGRQGNVSVQRGEAFFVEPVSETLRRAEQLLADFQKPVPPGFEALRQRAGALAEREKTEGPDGNARTALCRDARWLARDVALSNPLLDFQELLLVKRFTQQTYPDVCLNHMPWCSRPGGDLCVVSPPRPEGQARPLINGQLGPGHVHGMDLWYGADRVVFGYAKSPSEEPHKDWLNRAAAYHLRRAVEPTHLFEIGIDGKGVRQLTDGEWSDLDPTYLPSGDVAFASERCGYSLQCNELNKDETSCNLYIMGPDGSGVRRLTVTKDGDYLPHTLDNGLIAYTRWEYQERLWANIQSIWIIRPDGTGADALFKQHFNDPWALEDVRSIPQSDKLVAIATGHHTLATGPVVIIDPAVGINNPAGIQIVTPGVLPPEGGMSGTTVPEGGVPGAGGMYQTPWPLSEKSFLVSYTFGDTRDEKGYAIYLIDVYGTRELLYRDPEISCSSPIPLRPRRKPPVLESITAHDHDADKDAATCAVTNIYDGLEGVEPGVIRYLRISSREAWPYDNTYGGHRFEPDVKGVMINWTPARVIGTVPVEEDGSAHFRVPVDTAVYFQALDANHREVRRMRSFVSFHPGEVRGCTGCHETRAAAPGSVPSGLPLALRRRASVPVPPPWGTQVVSFLRDIQPVLDRHCAGCHGGLTPEGDIDLTGGLTAGHNRAWETINAKKLIARSNVGDDARITAPYEFGSSKSKLIQVLDDKNHAPAVDLSHDDWLRLVTWIDLNGPYHARFLNKRVAHPAYNLAADTELQATLLAVHGKRCGDCHKPEQVSRLDWIHIRRPQQSRFLSAPLTDSAGGKGTCAGTPYQTADDADYRTVLEAVRAAVGRTWERPRRDVQTLLPGNVPQAVARTGWPSGMRSSSAGANVTICGRCQGAGCP